MNLWDSAWTIIDRYLEYLSPDEKAVLQMKVIRGLRDGV